MRTNDTHDTIHWTYSQLTFGYDFLYDSDRIGNRVWRRRSRYVRGSKIVNAVKRNQMHCKEEDQNKMVGKEEGEKRVIIMH